MGAQKKNAATPNAGRGTRKKEQQNEEQAARGLQGDRLIGVSAASGRAVLVHADQERPSVHPGDILVAANVGPEWTPAFALLGGLVLDEGSLSQHAAIVAREYRIPSVMQTRDATQAIRDGQNIIVDGNDGIVELAPPDSGLQ
ncbi:MAG: PEP-utilizing enzyme [Candidatus Latescibacterota bacterium]|jgi:phosphoenolpyruvate synthase/pyruvate phosphate dikinase